jgi:hypothetical protein
VTAVTPQRRARYRFEVMLERFFTEGGFAMFFLLAFGIATLVAAVLYAVRVTRSALRVALALAAATGFATLTGICVDLAEVGHSAPDYVRRHPEMSLVEAVLQGVAESLAPGILGFTVLSLAALILTLGFYREPSA